MKVLTTLFFGAVLVTQLRSSDDAMSKQFQLFHQHHPTRVPAIFHRIRERLTSRPVHAHPGGGFNHHQGYWQALHNNANPMQTTSVVSTLTTTLATILSSTAAVPEVTKESTTREFSTQESTTPTTTLSPKALSNTVTSPSFTTSSSTAEATTTPITFIPTKHSQTIPSLPFFLVTTTKVTTESTSTTELTTEKTTTQSLTEKPTTEATTVKTTTEKPTTEALTTKMTTTQSTTQNPTTTQSSTQNPSTAFTTPQTTSTTSSSTSKPPETTTIPPQTSAPTTTKGTTSLPPQTSATTTTTTTKDPCANRTALYANGETLIKLCYFADSVVWETARKRCMGMGYRLFEPTILNEELALFKYVKYFAFNNQFFWLNGIAEVVGDEADWHAHDPYHVWNYQTTSWFGLVDAPVPGMCLGVIYINSAAKFTAKSCDSFKAPFWCEYH